MAWLARTHRLLPPALAHTCGLFMDVGIPLLAQRFPGPDGYLATLSRANDSLEPFTAIEEAAHQCNHTLVGALTARTWGVSPTVVLAVRLHHEYPGWAGPLPPQVGELVALGLVTDLLIQSYQGKNVHLEWEKGGAAAMARLALSPEALGDWEGALHQLFDLTGV